MVKIDQRRSSAFMGRRAGRVSRSAAWRTVVQASALTHWLPSPSARLLLAPQNRDKTFSGKGWPATAAPQARTRMRTGLPGIRPALTVALNAGMGSSYLNAEVNALERFQMIPGRNSSSSSYAQVCCFWGARLDETPGDILPLGRFISQQKGKDSIEKAAAREGVSMSPFIVERALNAAKRVRSQTAQVRG
jgi:Protein of unknown function (DUF1778)